MEEDKILNEGGINGLGLGLINTNSQDFKALQQAIKRFSKNLTEEQKLENRLLSIRFQMEAYLNQEEPEKIVPAGKFLKDFLRALKIKNKDFAAYIDYEESNLSAVLSGNRKINTDLALKFGKIFKVNPAIWLHIQSKNELLELKAEKEDQYDQYELEELLRKS